MAWRPHNRKITNEQFADDTTIDGSRIETALEDVVEYVNETPCGSVKNRYTQTQIVMGWSPQMFKTFAAVAIPMTDRTPWMYQRNINSNVVVIPNTADQNLPESFQNVYRIKGHEIPGLDPAEQIGLGADALSTRDKQVIWTTPIGFNKSVIMKDMEVFFCTDATAGLANPYTNGYTWGTAPETADPTNTRDVIVEITQDRPVGYGSENRALSSVVSIKRNFRVNTAVIGALSGTAPTTDMQPTGYPGGHLKAYRFSLDINQPIPEHSRLRFSICIPEGYNTPSVNSSWTLDQHTSRTTRGWAQQYYSVVITVLEELEE
jgi:hypothetical protein